MGNTFLISKNTVVITDYKNDVLKNAAEILQRDILIAVTGESENNFITLCLATKEKFTGDEFNIQLVDSQHIKIEASTDLGIMYGVLNVSKYILKIDDFWFWLDKEVEKVSTIQVTDTTKLKLPKYHVNYRGWFVNDEVLLSNWGYYESTDGLWKIIFETLLRCGGNIVIPGTDQNSHLNRALANEMGLMIAHHHAEPLGAEMFSRVYPELEASYLKYPDLFKKLWQKSIKQQSNYQVLWNIGFRGQGDRPFWEDDDHEYSLEEKANVINKVITTQYEMIKENDSEAICSMNIYGELTELFNKGLLKFPKDVIGIWADNGYGKMVSRRQGNDDPREEVLTAQTSSLKQGIYYHVAFHDLQASNFLTLLPLHPEFIATELLQVRQAKMDNLVICNTGNIKPHILFLRLVAQFWKSQFEEQSNEQLIQEYVTNYYTSKHQAIHSIYTQYFTTTFNYGPFEDQKVSDEFYAYTLRKIITAWLVKSKQLSEMEWLTGDRNFKEQLLFIKQMIEPATRPFSLLEKDAEMLLNQLSFSDRGRFYNDMYLNILTHSRSIQSLRATIDAFDLFSNQQYVPAFLRIDEAMQNMRMILTSWGNNPIEKWQSFYRNDCYTNISYSIHLLATLRSFIRLFDDGENGDQWERKYLMAKGDARVMLLSNFHKAYSDEEIAMKLKSKESRNK